MARTITVDGWEYKRRNPWGVLLLALVTIGIYRVVWWYKVNKEAKHYLHDPQLNPWLSVLAITLGSLIYVPPFVSAYRTGQRIQDIQIGAGVQKRIHPWLCVLFVLLLISVDATYMQYQLNKAWDMHAPSPQTVTAVPVRPD
jgi:uncharacterized membrane protein